MRSEHRLASILFACLLTAWPTVEAQQHRAVRLGHPTTRFAPPLTTPEQLRALLTEDLWKSDVAAILQQAGWKGNLEDLRRAAETAPISNVKLPIGTRMPFMSSRKDGKPIALIDVIWEGEEPISAYTFDFSSNQRSYRCITPKPCSNFYIVDLGAALPEMAIECAAPGQVLIGRAFDVCLTVTNKGTATAPKTLVRLQSPVEASLLSKTEVVTTNADGSAMWTILNLEPGTAKQICATILSRQPTLLAFTASAQGTDGGVVHSRCDTQVLGVAGLLLETVDLEDPVEVGKEVVYEIKVTNQGLAPVTNLKVVCTLPESEEFISGTGTTQVHAQDRTITMEALAVHPSKAQAVWRVTVKALKMDDARFKTFLTGDQFQEPIQKDEATNLY